MNQLVCFYINIIDYQSVILRTPLLGRDIDFFCQIINTSKAFTKTLFGPIFTYRNTDSKSLQLPQSSPTIHKIEMCRLF